MKSTKDFADLLQMIQDKRQEYPSHGSAYDDAEIRLTEQEPKPEENDATETNETTEP